MSLYPQPVLLLARATYPRPWGDGSRVSAIEWTQQAVAVLSRKGWIITRSRLGAGHAMPDTAPLLAALEAIAGMSVKDKDTAANAVTTAKLALETIE